MTSDDLPLLDLGHQPLNIPIIDLEFKALIPPLTQEEFAQLDANIAEAGRARDPLVLWGSTLLDGHNRFAICTERKLPFTTTEVTGIATREDAVIWIIENQFGRRNLDSLTRCELAIKLEAAWAEKAKSNQKLAGKVGGQRKGSPTLANPSPVRPIDTRAEVAKAAGVLHGTLDKAKVVLTKATETQKADIRTGKTTINREFKTITGAERKAAQVEAVKAATLPTGKFAVIVADPPWAYEARAADATHRAANPYPSMALDDIRAMSVGNLAADNAILWLWTTNAHIFDAPSVAAAWGFTVKSVLTWAKDRMGTGDWLRGQTEHCLMCVRGKPVVTLTNQTTLIHGPMREHSRKPDEFYAMVEALCPAPIGGRVELFSRQPRHGWVGAGAEVGMFAIAA